MLEKKATAKLTKVMTSSSAELVRVNLDEVHEGEERYAVCGEPTGLPDVIHYKPATGR